MNGAGITEHVLADLLATRPTTRPPDTMSSPLPAPSISELAFISMRGAWLKLASATLKRLNSAARRSMFPPRQRTICRFLFSSFAWAKRTGANPSQNAGSLTPTTARFAW